MKSYDHETTRKARNKKNLLEWDETDLDLPVRPDEFYRVACESFRGGCVVSVDILERLYKWFIANVEREPMFHDYQEILLSIRISKEQPIRPSADRIEAQLKSYSDSLENMDEYVEREIAKEVSRRIEKKYIEDRREILKKHPSFKRERDRHQAFMENRYEIFDLVLMILDESHKASFEMSLKNIPKKTIERDRAITVVQFLLDSYRHLDCGIPGTAQTSPFTELVRIAFDAIGYPSKDPTRLIKECVKDPRRNKATGFGPVDYWDV